MLYNFTGANYWSAANKQAQREGMGSLLNPDYWGKIGLGTLQTGSLALAPLRGVTAGIKAGGGLLSSAKAGGTAAASDLLGTWPRRIFTGLGVLGAAGAASNTANAQPMASTPASKPAGKYDWVKGISTDAMLRSWDQTRLASILMGVNPSIQAPALSPSELEYFAQQRRNLQRGAGQASARDALQEKQAREDLSRQLAAINSYMAAAPQDVAATTAELGPAAELGYERTLEREGAASAQAARQSLKDFLARQELSAGQRGANVSSALSDIKRAEAATMEDKAQQFNNFLRQQFGIGR